MEGILGSIFNWIKGVYDFLTGLWDNLVKWFLYFIDMFTYFFESFFLTLWDLSKEVFFFIFDSVLELVVHILVLLDFDISFLDPCQSGITAEIANILGLIGLGEAFAIIISAITIRILLQLVPFTRLGS